MTGHIRRRGKSSWELKFDLGTDPLTGKRKTHFHSFKGTKREAEVALARLITGAADGNYVDPTKLTLSDFLKRWERDWMEHNVGAKSQERYKELIASYVTPYLGSTKNQKLRPAHLAELYASLLREGRRHPGRAANGALSPSTVRYVHRVLHRAFGRAVLWNIITNNPCESVDAPKPQDKEIEILNEAQVRDVLGKLRGRMMYLLAALGLGTGMRRGEMLGLMWKYVDLDGCRLRVEQSVEQTKKGLAFKPPKTKRGRRQLALAPSIVAELRAHRATQAAERLALGLGREPDDALVFRNPEGAPLLPNSVTTEWRRLVRALKLPRVSLHAWRHTHASQVIASGMDVLTLSRRLGHAKPSITLNIYGHLFRSTDDQAAAVFEKAFGGTLRE